MQAIRRQNLSAIDGEVH